MKKWLYVIAPGILLVFFLIYYRQQMSALDARDHQRAEAIAHQKAADTAHKKAIEDAARASAEKRSADDAAAAAKKEADREEKWAAEGKKIQDATSKSNADAAADLKRSNELQAELERLDKEKEATNQEDFNLLKQLESARVAQHNAEMEIQRMVTMITTRAEDSSLTQLPPDLPKPKKE